MSLPISRWVVYECTVHTSLSVHEFWTKHGMNPMPHPSYPPDLPRVTFFAAVVSLDEKSPEHGLFGNVLPMWKR